MSRAIHSTAKIVRYRCGCEFLDGYAYNFPATMLTKCGAWAEAMDKKRQGETSWPQWRYWQEHHCSGPVVHDTRDYDQRAYWGELGHIMRESEPRIWAMLEATDPTDESIA